MSSPFLEHRVPELLDEVVAMYRAARRPLASLTDDDLDAYFADAVEAYIADPRNAARFRAVNDIAAEYVLRRRQAPTERMVRLKEEVEKEPEYAAINQPHKPKLSLFIPLPGYDLGLPVVVLAFGNFALIPALGICAPEESELSFELSNEQWRKEEAERSAEFSWLLGVSAERSERRL